MNKPTLLVMAAGLGSRYGGLKQIDPVSDKGEIILDFSLYDAMMAGFDDVVFVIKKEHEKDFRELIDDRAGKHLRVSYAFQEEDDLPDGYSVPDGRIKPWGTAHAVWSARHQIDGPFAVINADDYYGSHAFQLIYDFLEKSRDGEKYHYAMVAYQLSKTMTENGTVARGLCSVSDQGTLDRVVEQTKIGWKDGEPAYTEDGGATWVPVKREQPVSMNFWGFTRSMMDELGRAFPAHLDRILADDPIKGEYQLPTVVSGLLEQGKADVRVLHTQDQWHGVTYKEDKQDVVNALQAMKDQGFYPDRLWK